MSVESIHPRFITDEDGKKIEVVLPIDTYHRLIEDLQDLAIMAERRDEPLISHDDLVAELKKDGLL